jgi:hypothetical protein
MRDTIFIIFAIMFCTAIAGALVALIIESVKMNNKPKVNAKK